MTAQLETGDMLVVTIPVPAREAAELAVTVDGLVVRVAGPDGFRRDVAVPSGADAGRLQAGLFHGILELRAPRTDGPASPQTRGVPVSDLD